MQITFLYGWMAGFPSPRPSPQRGEGGRRRSRGLSAQWMVPSPRPSLQRGEAERRRSRSLSAQWMVPSPRPSSQRGEGERRRAGISVRTKRFPLPCGERVRVRGKCRAGTTCGDTPSAPCSPYKDSGGTRRKGGGWSGSDTHPLASCC